MANWIDQYVARREGEKKRRWPVPKPETIVQIRQATKLSQVKFAEVYGFSASALSMWETGEHEPRETECMVLWMIKDRSWVVREQVERVRKQLGLDD